MEKREVFCKTNQLIYGYVQNLSNLYRFGQYDPQKINSLFQNSGDLFSTNTFITLENDALNEKNLLQRQEIIGYYRVLMEYYPIRNHFNDYFSYELTKQTKKFKTDNGRFTFYDLRNQMMNEIDQNKRAALLIEFDKILAKLPQLYRKIYGTMQTLAINLGYKTILDWAEEKQSCEIKKVMENAILFLNKNGDLIKKKIKSFCETVMKFNFNQLNISDIWRIYSMGDLKNYYKSNKFEFNSTKSIFDYFNNMGYKLVNCPGLIIDQERRTGKNPRAFSGKTINLGSDNAEYLTYLVVNPLSSFLDQRDIIHETAHTIHFLNIKPKLNPIFHISFDPTITDTIAILFESLFGKSGFLKKCYHIMKEESELIVKYVQFINEYIYINHTLNFVSQFQIINEKQVLTDEIFFKAQEEYEKKHYEIFGFHRNGSDHLARELDKFFGSQYYARSYANSINLEKKLLAEDSEWYNNKEIAIKLRDNYMEHGFSRNYEELLREWGVDPYSFPNL